MTAVRTDIDWSTKPYPWNEIGPSLRRECAAIASGTSRYAPRPFKGSASPGEILRQRREALGLTQAELAKASGLKGSQRVCNIESDREGAGPRKKLEAALDRLERLSPPPPVDAASPPSEPSPGDP